MFFKKFTIRRGLFFFGLLLIYFSIYILLKIFRIFDYIFFPSWKKTKIKKPIFIIGNPRGGTTFLYDLIAQDKKRFSQPLLWQSLFASVTLYKFFQFLGKINPRKFIILVNKFNSKFKALEKIHEINLLKPEEDEPFHVFTFLSVGMLLFCPFPEELEWLVIPDKLPEKTRKRLKKHYLRGLKRYMYCFGENKTYFCKSVMSSGRIELIKEAFPDAIIINPVRHPYKTIPSSISLIQAMWKIHSPELMGKTKQSKELAKWFISFYKHMLPYKKEAIVVDFEKLKANPKKIVESIYKKLGFKISKEFKKDLDIFLTKKKEEYKSGHTYSLEGYGLTKEYVYSELKEVFKEYNLKK